MLLWAWISYTELPLLDDWSMDVHSTGIWDHPDKKLKEWAQAGVHIFYSVLNQKIGSFMMAMIDHHHAVDHNIAEICIDWPFDKFDSAHGRVNTNRSKVLTGRGKDQTPQWWQSCWPSLPFSIDCPLGSALLTREQYASPLCLLKCLQKYALLFNESYILGTLCRFYAVSWIRRSTS